MSMLAERKRKARYVINPAKKPLWVTDSSGIKFGKELMEKMGWSAGKGLGSKEQGIQEPLRVSYKNDNKGMGYKGSEESWIKHQEEFNFLLNELANNTDDNVETKEAEKSEVMSLEKKSKLSKARVHYDKFIRGKDLSKYSEKDLSCILGSSKMKKANSEAAVEKETPSESNMYETSFGVTTINSGSITDYFKKKWTLNSLKSKNTNVDLSNEISDLEEQQFSEETNVLENKSKKRKSESIEESLNNGNASEGNENEEKEMKKHKKRRKELQIGTETKKKSKESNTDNTETQLEEVKKKRDKETQFEKVRKKNKKNEAGREEGEAECRDDQLKANTLESQGKVSKKKKDKTKSESQLDISETFGETECEKSKNKEEKEDKHQGETVLHSHKASLFQMKPFFGGSKKNLTAKALKLIYGAQIEKFKGANLGNILGYGYKKEIGKM